MSEPIKLGKLITDTQHRDAIHIAIVPVTSEYILTRGQHVRLAKGSTTKVEPSGSHLYEDSIGIVDPFLLDLIHPGEQFWLLLYPQTITSLRHEWTHPAFPVESESERWLREFADETGVTYSRLMSATEEWLKVGNWLIGGDEMVGKHVPDEFWEHYEKVTGRAVDENKKHSFFSCAC